MAGGCAHLLLSPVHSVTAAVSGSRSKHGLQTHSAGMAWELAGNADSQSPPPPAPGLLGQNLGLTGTLRFEKPRCRTHKVLPSDKRQNLLSYFNKLHQVPAHQRKLYSNIA